MKLLKSPGFTLLLFSLLHGQNLFASSAETLKEIVSIFRPEKLKDQENPQMVKVELINQIGLHGNNVDLKYSLKIRNESLLQRGEMYFWLGRLEKELFKEATIETLNSKYVYKSKSRSSGSRTGDKVEELWNESNNLFGNALSNLQRVDPLTPAIEKRIAETQENILALEKEWDKYNVALLEHIQSQINASSPSDKQGKCTIL